MGLGGVDPATCYDLVTLLRVNPGMLEQLVPADGPAAAVGVVAVGPGQAVAVAVGRRTGGPSPAMSRALLSMPRR